eukprot:Rhum_TRINITY_DN10453_c0_g2::Rhum_TRINITY_DN10453_c0_g2_i1::g.38460::m.38460
MQHSQQPSSEGGDVRQEYTHALAMCKAAAAEAAEENLVKRQRTVKYVALTVVLLLFVILGFRRALKPASPGFARRQQGQGPDLVLTEHSKRESSEAAQLEPASRTRSHDKSRHHEHGDDGDFIKVTSPPDNKNNDKQPAET